MTLFNYINHNIRVIKEEAKIGLIPCCVMRHYAIYARFDYYCKAGHIIQQAAYFAGIDFKVSERTVYRIIKRMEEEV